MQHMAIKAMDELMSEQDNNKMWQTTQRADAGMPEQQAENWESGSY